MITPVLERVEIPEAEREAMAIRVLQSWTRPDGEEFISLRLVTACAKTIREGYYLRLVFPPGADPGAWCLHMREILAWHRLGVL